MLPQLDIQLAVKFFLQHLRISPALGEAHRLTTKYMIAFLKTNLSGEPGYQNVLTPGYALTREPAVEFFVTEKRSPASIFDDWPPDFIYFMHQPGSEQARARKDPPSPLRIPRATQKR